MQFITDEYRKLNEELHGRNKNYGNHGGNFLPDVIALIRDLKTQEVLDYGCGKSDLANSLPFTINQYDPAVEKFSELPKPAELVVCTDVLEHVEPELLDNVIKHIYELTKKYAYLVIDIQEAQKTLADGRNAHLTVQNYPWWLDKLHKYFEMIFFKHLGKRFAVTLVPLDKKQG